MNGPKHFAEAERLLNGASDPDLHLAGIGHALLALVAALMEAETTEAWEQVLT